MLSAGGGAEVSDAFSQRASRIAGSDHRQIITRPVDIPPTEYRYPRIYLLLFRMLLYSQRDGAKAVSEAESIFFSNDITPFIG